MAGKQKEKRKKPPTKLGMGNGKARRYVEEQEEVMVTTTKKAGSGIRKTGGGNRSLTVEEEYEDNYDDDDDEEDDNNNYNHNNNNDHDNYYNDEEEEDVYEDQDDSDEIIDDRDNNLVCQKSQPTRPSGKNYLGGSHARARQTHSLQNITNHNRGGQEETPTCQGTRLDFPYTPAVSSMTGRSSHEHNYKLQLQASGYHQTTASGKNQVKEYVGKSLFRRLKFIVGESEMETYGPIASIVMSHFKVKDENKVEWWMHNKQTVHKEIRQRRNNIGTALRNAFRSK